MAKSHEGICKLCGQYKKLTFEHVPPEKAFNNSPVIEYQADQTNAMMTGENGRLPWDFNGLKGKTIQRGSGNYYLCSDCNSKTGTWYISEYIKLSYTFHDIIVKNNLAPGVACSFTINDIYPLRILKAVMTMYCDINHNCFGDDSLKAFLLDKDSTEFNNEKYQVYMYMASPSLRRIDGLSAMYLENVGIVATSEIGCYPIGSILCINKPSDYLPPGILINSFSNCKYNEKCTLKIDGIPYLERNSLFPCDFRSKEEFLKILHPSEEIDMRQETGKKDVHHTVEENYAPD